MDSLTAILPFLIPLALLGVLLASIPTGWEILKRGNDADPLRKEIERENDEKRADAQKAA